MGMYGIRQTGIMILIFFVLLSGCGTRNVLTADSTDTPEPSNSSPLKIAYRVYGETIRDDDGASLLDLSISYPVIDNPREDEGIAEINRYYEGQFADYVSDIISERAELAREERAMAISNGYEFRPHAYGQNAEIWYNGNNLLSVLNIQYENTGGAHPNTLWHAETFKADTGEKLSLARILGETEEAALAKVHETVLSQIEPQEGKEGFFYYDTWKHDISAYTPEDFLLTGKGILFYYQTYAIAPYVAGVQSFELPLEQAGSLTVNIPVLEESPEKKLAGRAAQLIQGNITTFKEIFKLSMLELDIPETGADGKMLFQVIDPRFPSYAELDRYVRGIYAAQAADALMSSGRYVDRAGQLYGDLNQDGGMEYDVDWNDYRYELNHITENEADLTLYVTSDTPAGKTSLEIEGKMVKENGVWLLEKMIF